MAHLQARIGHKVTKLYPNRSWKRPGADLQSSSKNTVNWGKTRQTDEKEYDSDPSSCGDVSSQTFSPSKKSRSDHRSSPSRSSQPPSLLSRMGLSPNLSQDDMSDGADVASIQLPLSARIGTTKDTPPHSSYSSPNIGSTEGDITRVLDSNGYHDITNSKHPQRASPQPPLPSLLNGSTPIDKHQPPGNIKHPDSDQTECNDDLVVKPSTKEASSLESLHNSIPHDSSKSNFSPSNKETTQTRLEDNLATSKSVTLSNSFPSREQEFEEGELASSKNITLSNSSLPREREFEEGELGDPKLLASEQVRDLLLPLVMKNAAHRVKDGDSDLSRHVAHSVLSDEVCSSFMDQMKEVRTEMHAHNTRSPHNLSQMDLTGEASKPGANHAPTSSKIGQKPPVGPRAMTMSYPIKTGKYIPPNGENATKTSPSNEVSEPVSAVSNHSHYPVSSSARGTHELGSRRTSSPERDHNRYSQHRDPRLDGHHSHSLSKHSRGQPYYRQSDLSRDRVRSRSPVTLATSLRPRSPPLHRRRSSPAGASQPIYFCDRAFRENSEEILSHRSGSPSGSSSYDRMSEHRQSFSHSSRRIEGTISPRWDTADSPQTPVYPFSRSHFGRHDADEVSRPRSPSFTHGRGPVLDEPPRHRRDSHVSIADSGSGFARHSLSPRRRQQHRQFSAERPLPHMPPRSTTPQPATHKPYYQAPRKKASFEQSHQEPHMESPSPGAGWISRHLTDRVASSHHHIEKPMVIDDEDMQGIVNEEVKIGPPEISGEMPISGPTILPCYNVPGIWFGKVALDNIGTLECSFEVDEITALKWHLQNKNVHGLQKERLQLQICCLSQKLVQSVMGSLKPDATAQDVTNAMLTIENDWPTPGHLIIVVNPQDKNKRIWLPNKLEPPYLPVCIEDCIFQGQNIVQFIQLSGMSERMFVLFATSRPLVDELQHVDHEEFILAPLQNTIDGGKGDVFDIGLGEVTISDLNIQMCDYSMHV